jgi:hypothetical protein
LARTAIFGKIGLQCGLWCQLRVKMRSLVALTLSQLLHDEQTSCGQAIRSQTGHKQTSVQSITSTALCYFYGVELERNAIAIANGPSNIVSVARKS